MALPTPAPGLVIRYAYLWEREAQRGEVSGRKDRPCALVIVVDHKQLGAMTYVAAITHSRPVAPGDGVRLPPAVKRRLGLDSEKSWIVTTEANVFVWPGHNIAALAGEAFEKSFVYGALPEAITEQVLRQFRDNVLLAKARVIKRT